MLCVDKRPKHIEKPVCLQFLNLGFPLLFVCGDGLSGCLSVCSHHGCHHGLLIHTGLASALQWWTSSSLRLVNGAFLPLPSMDGTMSAR